jgi:hypothetical protein
MVFVTSSSAINSACPAETFMIVRFPFFAIAMFLGYPESAAMHAAGASSNDMKTPR